MNGLSTRLSEKRFWVILFIVIVSISVLCAVFLAWEVYKFFYIYPNQPPEPITQGSFPTQPIWVFEAGETITSTPVVHGERIIIRTINGVHALDSTSGQQLWRADSPAETRLSDTTVSPLAADNYLVVPEKGSGIAAFTLDNGNLRWRTPPIDTDSFMQQIAPIESISLNDHSVYVVRDNWKLTSYDINDGTIQWEASIPSRSSFNLIADSQVVYLGGDYSIKAYDANNGELLWRKDFDNLVGPILLDGKQLFVSLSFGDRSLIALDLDNLEEIWYVDSEEIMEDEIRSLGLDERFLYAGGKSLIALSKDNGSVPWMTDQTGLLERPVVLDNQVYVRNKENNLYVFEATNGEEVGRLIVQPNSVMKGAPDRSPAIAGNLLIVPFGDDRVFAYQP
jgi:outer membrane protein assembly factor BamB